MNTFDASTLLHSDVFVICPDSGQIKVADDLLHLSPVNMKVLHCLLKQPGQVVTRSQVFEQVWGKQLVSDDTLTRAISDLRQLLGKHTKEKLIETLPKRGYRWLPEVKTQPIAPLPAAKTPLKLWLIPTLTALCVSALMYFWIASSLSASNYTPIMVTPIVADSAQLQTLAKHLDSILQQEILKTNTLRFISNRATTLDTYELYPTLSARFGVRWIIEGELTQLQKQRQLELKLVDAKTALVHKVFTFSFHSTEDYPSFVQNRLLPHLVTETQ